MSARLRQALLTLALIVVSIVFALVVIPAGIYTGFSLTTSSVTPRLVPQLAVAGIVLALLYGLWEILISPLAISAAEDSARLTGTVRSAIAIAVCFGFAYWGFDWLGFYLGGALMTLLLTALLGERHVAKVLLVPILTVAVIYLVFELGFDITLPRPTVLSVVPE